MKNYVSRGESVTVTVSANVSGGDVVAMGALAGVAYTDALSGSTVEVAMTGVYDLPKASGAITAGAKVFYDPVAKNVTTTVGSNIALGHAILAAASGDPTVRVRLFAS